MPRFQRKASAKWELDEGPVTPKEVKAGTKGLQQEKAPGVDRIQEAVLSSN